MIVKDIEWISDPEDKEAFVLIEGGGISIWAFAHPCSVTKGEKIDGFLSGLDCSSVASGDVDDFARLSDPVAKTYVLGGTIVGLQPVRILRVGGIDISLDDLPGDVSVGDRVTARCMRIDI